MSLPKSSIPYRRPLNPAHHILYIVRIVQYYPHRCIPCRLELQFLLPIQSPEQSVTTDYACVTLKQHPFCGFECSEPMPSYTLRCRSLKGKAINVLPSTGERSVRVQVGPYGGAVKGAGSNCPGRRRSFLSPDCPVSEMTIVHRLNLG